MQETIAIVGGGRMGRALAGTLGAAGPFGRGHDGAGIDRALLVPLVRATVETWAAEGAAALTGPIARGDEATVARHREAIAERAPDLLALYDVLADATRAVAAAPSRDLAPVTPR